MGSYARERAPDRIAALAGRGMDLVAFWDAAREVIAPAVEHHMAPCWFTFDPSSLLVTSHYDHHEIPELPADWLAHEYSGDDVHTMAGVARSARGASTLHEATGGDPSRSPGWSMYVRPYGGDQELLVALRSRRGHAWGMLALYREPGRPLFGPGEMDLLLRLSAPLAEGARRALLVGEASDPEGPDAPGLVVLTEEWEVDSLTPGVERWLGELTDGGWATGGGLPPAVLAVAGRALRTAESPDAPGDIAVARVLAPSGRWMVLHGTSLVASGARRVAVIVEPARPARIAPLLMEAYGLTGRERDVTERVLRGDSTTEIAAVLHVSPDTVQQHLKSVFEKTGVRSRRELVGRVFFSHYEPRLRDNERRVIDGAPVRGGPLPGASAPARAPIDP